MILFFDFLAENWCQDAKMLHGKVPKLNLALTERLRDPFHRYDMSYRRRGGFVYRG